MKFGKLLKSCSDDMPGMDNLFIRYKELKKQLKAIPVGKPGGESIASIDSLSPVERQFINTLNEDLNRCNQYFIEKEEDAVIKLQSLAEQVEQLSSEDQLQQLRTELVEVHGEMVLLLHWSLLNYAAVVKILKKHDKHTGLLLRAPYLANVLQQPFYSTSVMSRLVKRAEGLVHSVVKAEPEEAILGEQESTADSGGNSCVGLCRRTKLALETWQTLKETAHTPSTVLAVPEEGVNHAMKELTENLAATDKLVHLIHHVPKDKSNQDVDAPSSTKRVIEGQGDSASKKSKA